VSDLIESVEEPPPEEELPAPTDPVEPDDPHSEVARKNTSLGWALFGLSLLLFTGTWVVAFIYLALE
jgi:hypothetical protein